MNNTVIKNKPLHWKLFFDTFDGITGLRISGEEVTSRALFSLLIEETNLSINRYYE